MKEESVQMTNPAHRLHSFLVAAKANTSSTGIAATLTWAGDEVTKKGEQDVARALRLWVHLLEMAKVAEAADYSSNPQIGKQCSDGIGRIRRAMQAFSSHRPVNELFQGINVGDQALVSIAGTLLDQSGYETALDSTAVDEFDASLQEISDELESNDDIPDAAKATGRRIAETLRDAFRDYSVTGADGIGEALAMAYGLWLLNHSAMGPLNAQPEGSPIKKLWGKVQEITKAYSTIKASVEVGNLAAELIDFLSPPM